MGYLPMPRIDGSTHYQPFLVHPAASDIIMSPQSVLNSGRDFHRVCQDCYRDTSSPSSLAFYNKDDILVMRLPLRRHNGLYYCPLETFGLDTHTRHVCARLATDSSTPMELPTTIAYPRGSDATDDIVHTPAFEAYTNRLVSPLATPPSPGPAETIGDSWPRSLCDPPRFEPHLAPVDELEERTLASGADPDKPPEMGTPKTPTALPPDGSYVRRSRAKRRPVDQRRILESELWAARLGFCDGWQLDVIPLGATGTPNQFEYHPFRFIDFNEQAQLRRQAARRTAQRVRGVGQRFYFDFGFMRATTQDYGRPNPKTDRVVESHDGYTSYLLAIDEHSWHVWVFLTRSKEPPIEEACDFLTLFGLALGGLI